MPNDRSSICFPGSLDAGDVKDLGIFDQGAGRRVAKEAHALSNLRRLRFRRDNSVCPVSLVKPHDGCLFGDRDAYLELVAFAKATNRSSKYCLQKLFEDMALS